MKSNQQNLGTIKCSNLCTEIIEYTSKDEVAVCNLASIVLPKFCSPVGERKKEDLPLHGEIYNLGAIPSPASNADGIKENKGMEGIGEGKGGKEEGEGVEEVNTESSTYKGRNGYLFDHQRLYDVTKVITRNLNKIIDINYYPIPEARNSNMRHRPIGMGVQGKSLCFLLLLP